MKHIRLSSLVPALACAAVLVSQSGAVAASPQLPADVVLKQESRWLIAIPNGDRKTVESILSKNFKHIISKGKLLDRAQEMASMEKQPITMTPTELTVDFAGDAAVVHGLNTVTQAGKVVARERFTDVWIKENGDWKALSAQETAI